MHYINIVIDYNKRYILIIILIIYNITKTEHLYPLKHFFIGTALSPSISSVYSYVLRTWSGSQNGHMSHQKCSMLHFVTASFDSIGVVRNASTQCAG